MSRKKETKKQRRENEGRKAINPGFRARLTLFAPLLVPTVLGMVPAEAGFGRNTFCLGS